ncbi:MAG: 50S ribosomal protein L19 [Patescibacteria group bacterium]|jgi:large subunit ribosomal protein L19
MSDEDVKPTTDETPVEPVVSTEPAVEAPQEEAVIPEAFEGEATVVTMPHKELKPGMVIRVYEKIKDVTPDGEERERVQVFEGVVLHIRGTGNSRMMTVRKNSAGWMVEKIYPLASPIIEKIEVVKTYRVRRGKLSYLRGTDFRRKLKEVKTKK